MSDESCNCGCNTKPQEEKTEQCTCGCGTADKK